MVGRLHRLLPVLIAVVVVAAVVGAWQTTSMAVGGQPFTPPPFDEHKRALVDRYPPGELVFYTAPGKTYWFEQKLNSISSSFFSVSAWLVQVTTRALEYAWSFNLSALLQDLINPINRNISDNIWAYGGLMFTLVGAWIALQVANQQFTKMTAGLLALATVLAIAIWSENGIGTFVADMEEVGNDVARTVMTTGAEARPGMGDVIISMQDGIYKQMILEPWGEAHFKDLATAYLPEYSPNGKLPGEVFLGATHEIAEQEFRRLGGTKNPDLAPWYAEGSVGKRLGIATFTFLGVLLFIPIQLLLSLFVMGAKAATVVFSFGWPVAVFLAAWPWFNGLRFLKGYLVMMLLAPIFKFICSMGLSFYMAFLGGLMEAAPRIRGGWATITLIVLALVVFAKWFGGPIWSLFGSLFFRRATKVAHQNMSNRTQPQRRIRPVSSGAAPVRTRPARPLPIHRPQSAGTGVTAQQPGRPLTHQAPQRTTSLPLPNGRKAMAYQKRSAAPGAAGTGVLPRRLRSTVTAPPRHGYRIKGGTRPVVMNLVRVAGQPPATMNQRRSAPRQTRRTIGPVAAATAPQVSRNASTPTTKRRTRSKGRARRSGAGSGLMYLFGEHVLDRYRDRANRRQQGRGQPGSPRYQAQQQRRPQRPWQGRGHRQLDVKDLVQIFRQLSRTIQHTAQNSGSGRR